MGKKGGSGVEAAKNSSWRILSAPPIVLTSFSVVVADAAADVALLPARGRDWCQPDRQQRMTLAHLHPPPVDPRDTKVGACGEKCEQQTGSTALRGATGGGGWHPGESGKKKAATDAAGSG